MNMWLNGPGWGSARGERGTGWRKFFKLDAITDPGPSETFVFLDEREDSINDGTFVVDMAGWPNQPSQYRIIDYPKLPTTTVLEVFPLPMGTRKSSDGRIHGRCQSLLAVD